MKKILFALIALFCAAASYAQSALVGTLNHEGKITVFYGPNALVDAHNAAEDGDVITLSSGTFNGLTITKSLTIRGAGMLPNKTEKTEATQIITGIATECSNTIMEGMSMVYLRLGSSNNTFRKCVITNIDNSYDRSTYGNRLIHCMITSECAMAEGYSYVELEFTNCFVHSPYKSGSGGNMFNFNHCTIVCDYDSWPLGGVGSSTFNNCLIVGKGTSTSIHYSSRASYSLIINTDSDDPFGADDGTNWVESDAKTVMPNYTLDNYSPDNFKLGSAAASKYTGSDGTQIGMYGGALPFDPVVSVPHITNLSVTSTTTTSGTIFVDLDVKSGK